MNHQPGREPAALGQPLRLDGSPADLSSVLAKVTVRIEWADGGRTVQTYNRVEQVLLTEQRHVDLPDDITDPPDLATMQATPPAAVDFTITGHAVRDDSGVVDLRIWYPPPMPEEGDQAMTDQQPSDGTRWEETLIGGANGRVTGVIVRRRPTESDITPPTRAPTPGDRVRVSNLMSPAAMIGLVLKVADGRALVEAPAGWRASYPLDRLAVVDVPPDPTKPVTEPEVQIADPWRTVPDGDGPRYADDETVLRVASEQAQRWSGALEALAYYDSHGSGDITGPGLRLPRSRPPLPPGLEQLLRQVAMPDPAEDRAVLALTAAGLLAAFGVTCAAGRHIGPLRRRLPGGDRPGSDQSEQCLSCGEVSGE